MTDSPNIFSIPEPENCECLVWLFTISHSELYIRIRRPDGQIVQEVAFFAVEYFSGPLRWKGANLLVKPFLECLKILHTLERFDASSEDWSHRFKLYVFPNPRCDVQIVAAAAEVVDNH